MILQLIGSNRVHDLQNLCLLFFPLSNFSEEDGNRLTVRLGATEAQAVFECAAGRFEATAPYQPSRFDGERLALKRAAYDALSAATGLHSPWGLLTGIKSALYYQKLQQQYAENAARVMREDYLVEPPKIELCKKILRQRAPAVGLCGEKNVSLYISIPFCPSRCRYCSFVSSATSSEGDLLDLYLDCLCRELVYKAQLIRQGGYRVLSLYIGGGTPTVLNECQLKRLLEQVAQSVDLSHLLEYTVEAGRPDTITETKLDLLKAFGVNRISVNPQTLNDTVLKIIGRNHTVKDFFDAYEKACQKQFDINIDVIAGLPGDTLESFSESFSKIVSLQPADITLHTLYVKRGADYGMEHMIPKQEQAFLTGQMVSFAEETCDRNVYLPYYLYRQKNTVGNHENVGYARDGKQCLYNIFMMDDIQTVIGVGANAVTKIVRLSDGKIDRHMNTKYAYNYVKEPIRLIDGL